MFKRAVGRRKKIEIMHAAFAPLSIACTRTSLDNPDVMPWEQPGHVLRPPAPKPSIDDMPPMTPAEINRILRRVVCDSTKFKDKVHYHVAPLRTLAAATGYTRRQLWDAARVTSRVSQAMCSRLSPLLRKIEAGYVCCIRKHCPQGGVSWEFVNVVDTAVPEKDMQAHFHGAIRRIAVPKVQGKADPVDTVRHCDPEQITHRGPDITRARGRVRHDGHAHAGTRAGSSPHQGTYANRQSVASAGVEHRRADRQGQARVAGPDGRVRTGRGHG